MSGWGVHHIDIIHWALGVDAPRSVTAAGGTYVIHDNRETPDTLDALFEYNGVSVLGSMHHGNARLIEGRDYGIAFYGSKATLVIDREGYEIWPEVDPKSAVRSPGSNLDGTHARNFLDAVKSREKPFADLETSHRSSLPCLLANIAFRTGRKLRWDDKSERFIDDPDANHYLNREYRKPWVLPV